MSQQPQKPRRTALRPNSQQRNNPPVEPDFQQPQPSTSPQPTSPERIVVIQQTTSNPGGIVGVITWPFRKFFAAVLWLVQVIIAAMLRSVISFIVGVIVLILMSIFIAVYGVALVDSNMNIAQAFSLSIERIVHFIQTPGSFRDAAETIQNAIPTRTP